MKSFYDKDDYTIEDIQSLIDNQVEESIYIDFKSAGSLEKSDKKRMEMSKDVASFANSDGGIIVYGIKEVNHVASEFSFIDGNEFTKEWIETIINSYVQRRISDIKIYPIRVDGDIKKSVYVVKIPSSYDAPHLSKDNRYYKRYNFMSVPMEEYEVRQTYGRKSKSKLAISQWYLNDKYQDVTEEWVKVHLAIQVQNISNTYEKDYKVNVFMCNVSRLITIESLKTDTNHNFTSLKKGVWKLSVTSKEPLFPNETSNVVHCKLLLDKTDPIAAMRGVTVDIQLLYSSGQDTLSFDLLEAYDEMQKRHSLEVEET